ncbi:MAG: EF-hand domain-containing protein [Planctomycetota bacterium]
MGQETRPEGAAPQRPGLQRAQGQRPGEGRPGEGRFGGGPVTPEMAARGMALMLRNSPLMKALDTNEDGQLSASEIENAGKALLKLDKNGDGLVSTEEMAPEPGQMPAFGGPNGPGRPGQRPAGGDPAGAGRNPEMLQRMLQNLDKEKDGKISVDELPPQMKERAGRLDLNGDGVIDKTEIEQVMRRMEGVQAGNRRPEGGEPVRPRRPAPENE